MFTQPEDDFSHIVSTSTLKLGGNLEEVIIPRNSKIFLALFSSRVQAGFVSPADDYLEKTLDLNEYLIDHPAASFFVRVSGHSMIGAGIHDNDLLIVDRSLKAKHGSIIIAAINGELTVKRLKIQNGHYILAPENSDYPALEITEEMEFIVWGVVTTVVHQLNK
ncbi:LexA family protein [Candidatus Odyssella thessalonicensis]|uniref:LexA family protein n=1 Tax=Candidatus Odyssella thessalonicensis TaxID=84647 RepID=UPI000225BB2F|nr:translesion error-prone DNA polymerase V autoproteolytic subunit [Candidatus Odyssella thessalonicensis]